MSEWELQLGDCRELMRAVDPGSVAAIVTSPPYADQRKYNGSVDRSSPKNASRSQRSAAPLLYAADFVETFLPPMVDVLADDGALMLNFGIVIRDGEESAYADAILSGARELGLKLLHRIVWRKENGNTLSDPRFLRVTHEWVFWLAKSTDAYRGYDLETRTPHKPSSIRRIREPYVEDSDDERYRKRGSGSHRLHPEGARPTTVFDCPVGGERGIKHPAIMPLKLARHLVALCAPAGALVLDPFAGSSTTGVAAIQLGRRFLGMEIEEGYLPEARERLEAARFSPTVHAEQLALVDEAG